MRKGYVPFAVLGLLLAPAVEACGVCIEDKVAATYDHAVIERAGARRQVVVFVAVEGRGDAKRVARAAREAAAGSPFVDRGSVRVSESPAALSFAMDPARRTPQAALQAMERASREPGLRLSLVKVLP